MQIRILGCLGCGKQTLLPNRSPQEKPFAHPGWPTGEETLTVVCHSCGRLSDYSEGQSRSEEIQEDDPILQTRTFRRAVFACDQKGCEGRIAVHLETEKGATESAIKSRVLTASPNASHGGRHIVTADCALVFQETYHY